MMIRTLSPVVLVVLGALASACDDPVPPTAQGAVSYRIQSTPTGELCPVGSPARISIGAVTETQNAPVSDGDTDTNGKTIGVQCLVRKESNGTFTINARISQNKSVFAIAASSQPADNIQASVTVSTSDGINSFANVPNQPCTIKVQSEGTGFAIESGRVWASVSCPSLALQGSTTDGRCALGVSGQEQTYMLFQNCDD